MTGNSSDGAGTLQLGDLTVGRLGFGAMRLYHDATPVQVALGWLLAKSPVMLPIPGTSSVQQLEENVAAAELRLSEEEVATLSV